ncbi:MAG: exopolyphosphatase [Gammaproteobacteria bacterium]|nr:exopolyphosphatase [Gammaproteobacteria bacterium]
MPAYGPAHVPVAARPSPAPSQAAAQTLAAVDLGSNSFHMLVARVADGELHIVDRMREVVRLAAGLDARQRLTRKARRRALECLARFGQRLRGLPAGSVRAVGTNTLRQARNAGEFLTESQRVLGHPIDVISGREEARLIYLGVSHSLADDGGRRLVIDIGGGSTEFIIGERFDAQHMESLFMGCVGMSRQYFPDGALTRGNLERAVLAARLELQNIEAYYRRIGWQTAIGSSGTLLSIAEVVRAQRWSDHGITLEALHRLRKALIEAGSIKRLALNGLRAERAPIFPGGVAILLAAFEALGIERMTLSSGALREGLLYDLLGRIRHEDVRERTIAALTSRYQIDGVQAARVERTALACLAQTAAAWKLQDEAHRNALNWAARLHEIGLAIAHNQYHKHGAYLLANADLPGFTRQEQRLLAALVRGHRRKFPEAVFKELPDYQVEPARRLCVLLRLAVLLHRIRRDAAQPPLTLTATGKGLRLRFPSGWLARHPLTRADLAQEAEYLQAAKLKLSFG